MADCGDGGGKRGMAHCCKKHMERDCLSRAAICGDAADYVPAASAPQPFPYRSAVAAVGLHRCFLFLLAYHGRRARPLRTRPVVGQTAARREWFPALDDCPLAYSCDYGGERQIYLFQQMVPMPFSSYVLARAWCLLGDYGIQLRQPYGH